MCVSNVQLEPACVADAEVDVESKSERERRTVRAAEHGPKLPIHGALVRPLPRPVLLGAPPLPALLPPPRDMPQVLLPALQSRRAFAHRSDAREPRAVRRRKELDVGDERARVAGRAGRAGVVGVRVGGERRRGREAVRRRGERREREGRERGRGRRRRREGEVEVRREAREALPLRASERGVSSSRVQEGRRASERDRHARCRPCSSRSPRRRCALPGSASPRARSAARTAAR